MKRLFEDEYDMKSIYCLSPLPLPGHPGGLTNHVTLALFDLPIDSNDSVINGLHEVDKMIENTKQSVLPVCVSLYFALVGCHLYAVGNFLGKQRMVPTGKIIFCIVM